MRGRGQCRRHGRQFGPCSCSLGKLSRLVEPVVLYLLCENGPRYGYELLEMIPGLALTDSEIDVGAVYRTLKRLERAGCVTSRWEPGPGGPKRHVYTATRVGHQHLQDWATVLQRRGSQMVAFSDKARRLGGS
jgi:PadR family transcriptional regulator PadR